MTGGLLVTANGSDDEVAAAEDNVVELRAGQERDVLSCRHCGGDLWVATVTIDRVTLRPTGITDSGDRPVIRCWHCGRGHDPRKDKR